MLSQELDGLDEEQLRRIARYRINALRTTSRDLKALLDQFAPINVTECDRRSRMFGFYELLEKQASDADSESKQFAQVQAGAVSVWDYWDEQFVQRYRNSPSLEPLESIYSKSRPGVAWEAGQLASRSAVGRSAGRSETQHGAYLDINGVAHSEGKRKRSVARVDLSAGQGRLTINGQPYDHYFRDVHLRAFALQPFFITASLGRFNADVTVRGGGQSGQAQAVRTAVARALALQLPAQAKRLRALLRWDGRRVERKKPARKKARRGFQWVKR